MQGTATVTRVDPLVSPQHVGSTSIAIGGLYERNVIQHIPGYSRLHSWCSSAPVPTATSLSSLVRFLAQHYTMNVTAVDVGGANTTLMMAGEGGEFIPTVNCGVGVGPSLGTVLQQVGVQRVARWLPFDITEDELRQYVLNHMLHPHVVPTNQRDLQITHAFAREAINLTAENARTNSQQWLDADLILATGGVLAHAPKYGQAALVLLDALLLSLFPAPTVDVGLGPGERARAAEEIDGGLVGLIIDARGRPLVLPNEAKERQNRLSLWMQAIGA